MNQLAKVVLAHASSLITRLEFPGVSVFAISIIPAFCTEFLVNTIHEYPHSVISIAPTPEKALSEIGSLGRLDISQPLTNSFKSFVFPLSASGHLPFKD